MKIYKKFFVNLVLAFCIFSPVFAIAEVLNFDNIVIPDDPINPGLGHTFLSDGDFGLNWFGGAHQSSWVVSKASDNWFPGLQSHTGQNFVWSNGGVDLSISGKQFNINSFWARDGYGAFSMIARGYFGGNEIYTQLFELSDTYQQFNLNFFGIDNLTISNVDQVNILIDDISVSTIPEPATTALLITGICLILFLVRRRKSN